jgi:hypothetical protein
MKTQDPPTSLWKQDTLINALSTQGGVLVCVLPPSTLNSIQRDLSCDSASTARPALDIHVFYPAWWWRLPNDVHTMSRQRIHESVNQTYSAPTYVHSTDIDVVQSYTPLIRLVSGRNNTVDLIRLRRLDTLIYSMARIDYIVIGTGGFAIEILNGALSIIDKQAPTIIVDTSASFAGGECDLLDNELCHMMTKVGYNIFQPRSLAPQGRYAVFDKPKSFDLKPLFKFLSTNQDVRNLEPRRELEQFNKIWSAGWGQREFHDVELPAGVNCILIYIEGSHRGDVRILAIREGLVWFEDVCSIRFSDNQSTLYYTLPAQIHRPVAIRVRLTPIRNGTGASPDRMIVKYIISQ